MGHCVFRVFALVALVFSMYAHGGEARRCLRDGKVIITDVTCDLLGGATDLSPPIPEKHYQKGVPEKKVAVQEPLLPPIAPKQPKQLAQQADTAINQMIFSMIKALLIPFVSVTCLVVWFKHKTKNAVARRVSPVLPPIKWAGHENSLAIEPTSGSTSADRSRRQEPTWSQRICSTPADPDFGRGVLSEPMDGGGSAVGHIQSAPTEWSLDLIRNVEWKRFEDVCQQFYEKKGIRSETTALGPDGGIDIRLFQDDSGKPDSIVQCKAWGERYVGVKPVRELLGVMTHEKVGKACFMTSGSYTAEAKAIAEANCITLIDGATLLTMIQSLPTQERDSLLAFAIEGDYTTPTCPTCGVKMRAVEGKGERPDFWGCQRYPRCRQKLGMRRMTAAI